MSRLRPNILLIVADQWRSDCLGVAGNPCIETPHLDELAFYGARFSQAYSAVPTCIAARVALMTGMSQRRHRRVGYQEFVPWDYPATLAGTLAAGGYHTCCVGKMHVHPTRNLLGYHQVVLHDGGLMNNSRLCDNIDLHDDYGPWLRERVGPRASVLDTGLGVNSWAVAPWPYPDHTHPSVWAADQAIDFLRRRDPTRPFFLTLSTVRPHPPFDPPASWLALYDGKEPPEPAVGDWARQDDPGQLGLRCSFGEGLVRPDLALRARRAYYALISQLDQQYQRVISAIGGYAPGQETWVIFTSDHGELLGDHHLWAKAMPFAGSAGIPLIIRPPASAGIPGRTVIDALVELRDLMPTCCEIAGVPVPESCDGRSLLPLLRGETADWRQDLHGEHIFGERSNHWLTDGREKYVWWSRSGRELLFDLRADPQERYDLSAQCPERCAFLRTRLVNELRDRPEGIVAGSNLVPGYPELTTLPTEA